MAFRRMETSLGPGFGLGIEATVKGPPFWMAWYCVVVFSIFSRLLQVIVEFSQLVDKRQDLIPRRILQVSENCFQDTKITKCSMTIEGS